MRKLLYILLVLISTKSIGQPVISRGGAANTLKDERLMIGKNMFIPIYVDSIEANTNKGIDSSGAMYYDRSTKFIMYRQHNPKKWVSLVNPVQPLRFTNNVVVNGGAGTKVGVWSEGETIPLAGKLYDSLPYILATKCLHPPYASPTASISSASPSFGDKEIGTNLGTVTLTAGSPNNGGNSGGFTGNTFYQNGSPLGGNTTTISSLTTTQTFYVNRTYSQGACLPDNCGEIDCTGRINAGNVNSPNYFYTPRYKKYWGVSLGETPTNSEILAAIGGGSEFSSGLSKGAFSISIPSDTYYHVFYVYWSSYGNVNTIKDGNGLDVTLTFNSSTISVTNAQGYTFSAKAYVSGNIYSNTTYSISLIN